MSNAGNLYSLNIGYNVTDVATYGNNIFIISYNSVNYPADNTAGLHVVNFDTDTTVFGVPTQKGVVTTLIYGTNNSTYLLNAQDAPSNSYNLCTQNVSGNKQINNSSYGTNNIYNNINRIRVDSNGNVWFSTYVSSISYICVISATSGIKFSSAITSSIQNKWYKVFGIDSGVYCCALAIDSADNLYVGTNGTSSNTYNYIYVYTRTSTILYGVNISNAYTLTILCGSVTYGSITDNTTGTSIGSTSLHMPFGICFDSYGNMFISNYASNLIYIVVKTAGTYYNRDLSANKAYIFASNTGTFNTLNATTKSVNIYNLLKNPAGIMMDIDNNLYICSSQAYRILVIPCITNKNNYFPVTGTMGNVYILAGTGSNLPGTAVNNAYPLSVAINEPVGLTFDTRQNLYIADRYNNTYLRYIIAKTAQPIPITDISFDNINTKQVALGNVQVSIYDASNSASNNLYYFYSVNSTPPTANSNVLNVGPAGSPYKFYVPTTDISNTIYVQVKNASGNTSNIANIQVISYIQPQVPPIYNVSLVSSGNIQVTVGEGLPSIQYYYLNNVSYVAYLYTGGTNQSGNLSYYTYNVGVLANTNTTYGNVVSYISGLSANTYTVYLAARNSVGNTISAGTNQIISVYTTPGNVSLSTTTVAAGNLLVSITDVSNTATVNNVYYFYSTDGTTFVNTNILAGSSASPYRLYLNIPDISDTIFVTACNPVGNSATANIQTLIFQTPRNPPIFGVSLAGSGNLQVTVGESNPLPSDTYYYLNNVSYVAYLYTGGTNQSGNLSYYTYNVGVLANTNTTYGNVVSYISGLSANTYTVYLAARNSVGNTISSGANLTVSVFTIPSYAPIIDTGNTYISGSGNLTITFTDSLNDPANGITYNYYLYNIKMNKYILFG